MPCCPFPPAALRIARSFAGGSRPTLPPRAGSSISRSAGNGRSRTESSALGAIATRHAGHDAESRAQLSVLAGWRASF